MADDEKKKAATPSKASTPTKGATPTKAASPAAGSKAASPAGSAKAASPAAPGKVDPKAAGKGGKVDPKAAAAAAKPAEPVRELTEAEKAAEEAKKAKQAEIEKKRAEVRKRMEEASKLKKAKKGFMTPERKKKLRLLLRKKAAEELKKEQERKAAERRRIIEERCGTPKDLDYANEDELREICQDYFERMYACEGDKWDLEYEVRKREWEISDLNAQVNDLRGKFVRPPLKKVSKYENKFAKLQKKAAEFNFRNQLKVVKKKEFTMDEEEKEKKPDWSKGKPGDAKDCDYYYNDEGLEI